MNNHEKIFNDLVQDNQASIYRICYAYLYDKSHAGDLYQEILLQVWKSIPKYKGNAKMSTWVYRIAVNTAITYNARNARNTHIELSERTDLPENGTDESKEKEEMLSRLSYAISLLEQQDRLIISLVLEDLSYKEIAEITGSNSNNTGVRIKRIKERLLKLMSTKTTTNGL